MALLKKIKNLCKTKEGIKTIAIVALVVLSLGASITTGRLAKERKDIASEKEKLKKQRELLTDNLSGAQLYIRKLEEKLENNLVQNKVIEDMNEHYSNAIADAVNKKGEDSKNPSMKITKADTKRALKSAENRVMDEYLRITALILATMDVETNFKHITNDNPNGTKDHGIMQVNDAIIKQANESLGEHLDPVNDDDDNVEVGSWEVYECYNRAKEKHPEDVIWWTYAYYNRGLYFERADYWTNPNHPDYKQARKQADARSAKFKQDYERYYKALVEETK